MASKKIKCWLCGGWQDEKYTRAVDFNGIEETVCLNCVTMMTIREDQLEQKLIELEDVAQFRVVTKEKEHNPKGGPDETPAKETFLP